MTLWVSLPMEHTRSSLASAGQHCVLREVCGRRKCQASGTRHQHTEQRDKLLESTKVPIVTELSTSRPDFRVSVPASRKRRRCHTFCPFRQFGEITHVQSALRSLRHCTSCDISEDARSASAGRVLTGIPSRPLHRGRD